MTARTLRELLTEVADQVALDGIATPNATPQVENVGAYFAHVYAQDLPPVAAERTLPKSGPEPAPKRDQDRPEVAMVTREISVAQEMRLVPGWPNDEHWHQVGADVWVDSVTGARLTFLPGGMRATLETPADGGWPQ